MKHFNFTKIIDLTHTIAENIPYWPEESIQNNLFHKRIISEHKESGFLSHMINIPEHYGTHIDAPIHGDETKISVDQIPIERLASNGIVIDTEEKVKSDYDYQLEIADIQSWEKKFGKIYDKSIVIMRTGWSKYWYDAKKYLNMDNRGIMHFPGFSRRAIEFLINERGINGIGVETLSIDCGNSSKFEVHRSLFEANRYAIENLANIDLLPPKDFLILSLPLKIKGGSGSPARVVALI